MDYSRTIAACNLKVSVCRQLIELMKVCHLYMKIKTGFSQKQLGHFEPNFVYKLSGTRK